MREGYVWVSVKPPFVICAMVEKSLFFIILETIMILGWCGSSLFKWIKVALFIIVVIEKDGWRRISHSAIWFRIYSGVLYLESFYILFGGEGIRPYARRKFVPPWILLQKLLTLSNHTSSIGNHLKPFLTQVSRVAVLTR